MKNLPTLALLILCMSGMAAQNPSFSSFNTNYFLTNGYIISLNGAIVTSGSNALNGSGLPSLNHWRSAVAKASIGQGRATICFVGDSMTTGDGSMGGDGITNSILGSYPTLFQRFIQNGSFGWIGSHFYGSQAGGGEYSSGALDYRLNYANNWSIQGLPSVGGYLFLAAAGATNPMTFVWTNSCNFARVYYYASPGNGAWALYDNGTKLGDVFSSASAGLASTVFNVTTAAPHSFSLNPYATNIGAYFIGFSVGNSTNSIVCLNAGWDGSTTGDWAGSGSGFSPLPTLAAIKPDLYVISLGVNDIHTSVPISTFSNNLAKIVSTIKTSTSDVVLETPLYWNGFSNPYGSTVSALASLYGCAFYDIAAREQSYAQENANGFTFDVVHLNQMGYYDWASGLAAFLNTLCPPPLK